MTHKLLFIDDHAAIFDSLIDVIKDKLDSAEIIVYEDANTALDYLQSGNVCDLILLDLNMPSMSGYQFIEELQNNGIYIPTAILSGYISQEKLKEIKELGAVGYIPKTSNTQNLIKAITTILSGEYFFSEHEVTEYETTLAASRSALAEKLKISPRQFQVLEHLTEGLTNKQIAETLFIAEETVRSHVKALHVALQTNNRVGLTKEATKWGLVE